MLAQASRATGLPVVTEVMDTATLDEVAGTAQVLQVGTRNAQDFPLLRAVGRTGLPVLLKRGFGCTIDEWLQAAEYILNEGNDQVILCERGIRTFERHTRFTLDLSAVPVVKHLSHLSHRRGSQPRNGEELPDDPALARRRRRRRRHPGRCPPQACVGQVRRRPGPRHRRIREPHVPSP
jgi:DAHP synthetase I family